MSGDDAEKPHDPTQKKLDDARKRGEIARSTDLLTAASYGGFLLACAGFGAWSVRKVGTTLEILLDRPDTLAPLMLSDGGHTLAAGLSWQVIGGVAPFVALPAAAVAVALMAQQAVIFAPTKLKPKLSRISPIANFRNRFGPSGLFEFGKSFVKLSVYSLVLALFLKAGLPDLIGLAGLGAGPVSAVMARDLMSFMGIVLAIATVIAVIDLIWQHADHRRRNRMSHKEMTDEYKESEGDPMMKQQRRQRGYDIATNRMLLDVPKANVVIVNPTHYAVALKWDRKAKGAPVCVAKGVDEVAARIREAAHTAGVPVRSDPPAARALHATVEIGQEIRREHYAAVAAAIRFAEAMRARKRAGV